MPADLPRPRVVADWHAAADPDGCLMIAVPHRRGRDERPSKRGHEGRKRDGRCSPPRSPDARSKSSRSTSCDPAVSPTAASSADGADPGDRHSIQRTRRIEQALAAIRAPAAKDFERPAARDTRARPLPIERRAPERLRLLTRSLLAGVLPVRPKQRRDGPRVSGFLVRRPAYVAWTVNVSAAPRSAARTWCACACRSPGGSSA